MAFNFLLAEVCGALEQGLEAEHPEITGRWGGRTYSRTYVTRLLRELGDKEIFLRDWHQERNEETGRTSRFRTFNLNRTHPLVREALVSQWGPDTDTVIHEPEPPAEEAPETPAAVEPVEELPASTNEVEAETQAEETTPPPARPSRRRGRRAQPASETAESSDQAPTQAEASESVSEEAAPASPASPSRRRGRQRQTAEETTQSSDRVPQETETGGSRDGRVRGGRGGARAAIPPPRPPAPIRRCGFPTPRTRRPPSLG